MIMSESGYRLAVRETIDDAALKQASAARS